MSPSVSGVASEFTVAVLTRQVVTSEGEMTCRDIFGTEAAECIICMSDPRTTVAMPCRHLCYCQECAQIMQARCENCPICRQEVASLLQMEQVGGKVDTVELDPRFVPKTIPGSQMRLV